MKITTFSFSLITGMMLGFEYVDPEVNDGVHAFVIDFLFIRLLVQHGDVEEY